MPAGPEPHAEEGRPAQPLEASHLQPFSKTVLLPARSRFRTCRHFDCQTPKADYTGTIMLWALKLAVTPATTWEKIGESKRHPLQVLILYLVPWLALTAAAESWALVRWGDPVGQFGHLVRYPVDAAIRFGLAECGIGLGVVVVATLATWWLGNGFHYEVPFTASFVLVAYGLGPVFGARLLDCHPALPTWLCWGAGAIGSALMLYGGTGHMLRPPPTKGFGLYLMVVFVCVALSGIGHVLTRAFLLSLARGAM